jgi:FkbM family methyltransferase
MSKCVGDGGKVWAFEPAALTAHFLGRSLTENGAANVVVSGSALSDRVGSASFHISKDSELSGLGSSADIVSTEQVPTTTLDHCASNWGRNDIAFLKLDAEGHERQVLSGGRDFFARQSPLVMYEVVEVKKIYDELIDLFVDYGYRSYRLVPGLGILVPFDDPGLAHVKLLNLFCCKPDRAAVLANRGLLVDAAGALPQPAADAGKTYLEGAAYFDAQSRLLGPIGGATTGPRALYLEAVGWYALSESDSLPPAERYACLLRCASLLEPISGAHGRESLARVSLLARVALDLGWRLMAADLLAPLVARLARGEHLPPDDPVIPVLGRFDGLDPGDQIDAWIAAGLIEGYLRNVNFSSLRARPSHLAAYEFLKSNPFASPEMTRRRLLIRYRMGLAPDTGAEDPVYAWARDNLNAEFWKKEFPPTNPPPDFASA